MIEHHHQTFVRSCPRRWSREDPKKGSLSPCSSINHGRGDDNITSSPLRPHFHPSEPLIAHPNFFGVNVSTELITIYNHIFPLSSIEEGMSACPDSDRSLLEMTSAVSDRPPHSTTTSGKGAISTAGGVVSVSKSMPPSDAVVASSGSPLIGSSFPTASPLTLLSTF